MIRKEQDKTLVLIKPAGDSGRDVGKTIGELGVRSEAGPTQEVEESRRIMGSRVTKVWQGRNR